MTIDYQCLLIFGMRHIATWHIVLILITPLLIFCHFHEDNNLKSLDRLALQAALQSSSDRCCNRLKLHSDTSLLAPIEN
jgi:hypothetical protein